MSTPVEELRNQLTEAAKGAVDDETRAHIETAMELVDEVSDPELLKCPVCGRMGLPERIVNHECEIRSTENSSNHL
jgi:ribosomal protein L32